MESFQAQARDVEQPQPFVLGGPPERTGSITLQGDVDPVIADAVVDRVRQRCVGVLTVYRGCDLMVEGERVPAKRPLGRSDAATRSKQRRRSAQMGRCSRDRPGQRSWPPVPRVQALVCLLRVGRARLPPQPRALAPARASPAKSQSRPHACPSPEQRGSQHARYQPQARPVARQPHAQARRRTGRQQSRQPTTPRSDPPKPRTSSTWRRQSTSKRGGVRLRQCSAMTAESWLDPEAAALQVVGVMASAAGRVRSRRVRGARSERWPRPRRRGCPRR